MAHVLVDNSDVAPSKSKFHKPNNYVKINKTTNIVDEHAVGASNSIIACSSIFWINHNFTPLFVYLYYIMGR